MEKSGAEPPQAQNHDSGGETMAGTLPPPGPATFPQRPAQQQEQLQTQSTFLIRPLPGGLTKSPEELTRQVGWTALVEAVTKSATTLYPDDPQAVAMTVANSLQPYIVAFAPRMHAGLSTSGT